MENNLARSFRLSSLLRFALPSMIMMVFSSLYQTVDGFFIARWAGTDALSALNIVYPMVFLIIGSGSMLGAGGSALLARRMGEGKDVKADFTLLVLFGVLLAAAVSGAILPGMDPLLRFLGASDLLMPYCRSYLSILSLGLPFYMLQLLFQHFFVTAGRPHLGMLVVIGAGVLNILFDYLLVAVLGCGIAGAAIATVLGYLAPSVIGLVYFSRNRGPLRFVRPSRSLAAVRKSCANGVGDLVFNLAAGLITALFNRIMMELEGEAGVAAITIVLYSQFLFTAVFMGFSNGLAPVISYKYGAGDLPQLRSIFRICMSSVCVGSCVMTGIAYLLAVPVVELFAPAGGGAHDLAVHGFYLFSTNYPFSGCNLFIPTLFIALSNGRISSLLSLLHSFAFVVLGLTLLPIFWDTDGAWLAVPLAEALGFLCALACLLYGRRRYHYF